ncbi:UNVERIFIED_ORG: hypothetical protein M2328_005752 [Rhodococcus erythropolis]
MTDAPDPGLTDLIAAHDPSGRYMATNEIRCGCGWLGPASDWPAHVALVVEQHTNGRIARLREHVEELAARGLPADLNPTVLGKADYVWWSNYLHRIDQTVRSNARAALEGEQQ